MVLLRLMGTTSGLLRHHFLRCWPTKCFSDPPVPQTVRFGAVLAQGQLQGGYLEAPVRKGWDCGSQLAGLNSWPAPSIDQGQCRQVVSLLLARTWTPPPALTLSPPPPPRAKAPQLFPSTLSSPDQCVLLSRVGEPFSSDPRKWLLYLQRLQLPQNFWSVLKAPGTSRTFSWPLR